MFENFKTFKYQLAGRPLVIETGKMAELANGSCLVKYGDTIILACATASEKPRDGINFLPLSIDFEERLYAVGRVPGSYNRREGRPTEKAVLSARVIDRSLRPLFPKDLRNDIVISLIVLSVDNDCSPEIAGLIGASIAISISDIPWNGPIGGVSVGMIDGVPVLNPTSEQREKSTLELTVAASFEKVVMIEAGAKEVADDDMYNAIMYAHTEIKKICGFISDITMETGKDKFAYDVHETDETLFNDIKDMVYEDVKLALDTDDKNIRDERMAPIKEAVLMKYGDRFPDNATALIEIEELLYDIQKIIDRRWLLDEGKRVDGRKLDQIRELNAEVALLPRVHGSGMFTRGQTQVLTVAT
ncbi:MAG: polyribonucleotide nucleotidyltransferase, partial [Eubacteriales bacterium]|nr:polyribonucleotide nucleotidyltransferase [Eubacteriales bacterium]